MKKVIAHKFYLKHNQNGVIFLFTLFLLLIILILTIAFLYLQFLEVDLIAYETEYLQAFYLAEAGLEHGLKEANENPDIYNALKNEEDRELTCDEMKGINGKEYPITLASNKKGSFCYGYKLEDTEIRDFYKSKYPDIDNIQDIVTITGRGYIHEEGETTSRKEENRREIEKRFFVQGERVPKDDFPDSFFGDMADKLDYAVVTSRLEPQQFEKITIIIKHRDERVSGDQKELLTESGMNQSQRLEYKNFKERSKNKIAQARLIEENNNELLFPEETRSLYYSSSEGITSTAHLQMLCGDDCPFEYTENRESQGIRISIKPKMILKSNREITLDNGLYFFESLTLKENSTIKTNGDVLIYVKKLELKENARLMGGTSNDFKKASPNDLIILAQYWEGVFYSLENDGVKIGPSAKVCGHIFAPSLKVRLSRGLSFGPPTGRGPTVVYGSILTEQLITYVLTGSLSNVGPIWVIYSGYLEPEFAEIPYSWREVRNP